MGDSHIKPYNIVILFMSQARSSTQQEQWHPHLLSGHWSTHSQLPASGACLSKLISPAHLCLFDPHGRRRQNALQFVSACSYHASCIAKLVPVYTPSSLRALPVQNGCVQSRGSCRVCPVTWPSPSVIHECLRPGVPVRIARPYGALRLHRGAGHKACRQQWPPCGAPALYTSEHDTRLQNAQAV